MQTEFCPLCSKNGAKVKIKAYQINDKEAVFMCSTEDCTWPAGYHELLFMDRPFGKYLSKDWPDVADKFLANYFKKQRDKLSELSAYTPPQTPGNCKDTIVDSTTAAPTSRYAAEEDNGCLRVSTTAESKLSELPILDFTSSNMFSSEMKVNYPEHLVDFRPDKPVKEVVTNNSDTNPLSNNRIVFASNLVNMPTSLVDKPSNVKIVKSSSNVPVSNVKSVANDKVWQKKYLVIGKKPKTFTYKKQFDLFDDIKKAKINNEQNKGKVVVKSKINLTKMSPKEIREVLFMKNGSKINDSHNLCKGEANVQKNNKVEQKSQLTKQEKKPNQSDVDIIFEKEIKNTDTDDIIEIFHSNDNNKLKKEENNSLKILNKEPTNTSTIQYDFDSFIKTDSKELVSADNWCSVHDDLDSLLAMLDNDVSKDNSLTVNNSLTNDASSSNVALLTESLKTNVMDVTRFKKSNDNSIDNVYDNDAKKIKLESNLSVEDNNQQCSTGSANNNNIDGNVKKEEIDLLIEDDILQCSIDDTDEFFNCLFSPAAVN